jgi:putative hemolysin
VTLFMLSVSFALIISFLCSISEAAVLSLSPSQIAKMSAANPAAAEIWKGFKKNIDRPISAILFLNTSAHTIGASVAGAQFDEIYGDEWIWAFSLILTFVMLQWTELAPKTLGVKHNYAVAIYIAKPLDVLVRFLQPLLRLLHALNRPFSRGAKSPEAGALDELSSMASFARLSNAISADQEKIIRSVPKLSARTARQLMIPVEQVVFIKAEHEIKDAIAVAQGDPHTRFPVYADGSTDNIIGYVNLKELLLHVNAHPDETELRPIRPVKLVEQDTSAQDLLRIFMNERAHMAIVKEGKTTLGLLTMEDVIEEVLGELEDEFDRLPRMCQQVSPDIWMVGGGLTVQEFSERTRAFLRAEEKRSLSDWFTDQLGRTPTTGDSVRAAGKIFQVRRMRRGKVFELIVMGKGRLPLP